MTERRWPKKLLQWIHVGCRRRGQPKQEWFKQMKKYMEQRGLEDNQWENKELWNLECEQ